MLTLILVPLDGSGFGEQAIPTAQRLAERERAELELVHVAETLAPYEAQGAPPLDPRLDREQESDRASYLNSLAGWLRHRTSVTVKATLLEGPVASTLAEYVRARGSDLVVMSTHGRGGLSRLWLGSVATELVRQSPVPVVLIRPTEEGSRSQAAPAFERVLLPLDVSSEEPEALEHAQAVAGSGAQYLLLHIIAPLIEPIDPQATTVDPIDEDLERMALRFLEDLAEPLRARGFRVDTRVVRHANTARAILEEAERERSDLIAMETHAHRFVERLLFGSVADKVVRGAHIPLLLHRPQASGVDEETLERQADASQRR